MSQPNEFPVFPKSSSEIRLLEKVRLQSFQGLLPDAENRVRCPGKHPPVLIEDILKAEIMSLQLVSAMEEVVKSVNLFFSLQNTTKTSKENNDVASLKCFQNALSQGTITLNQLTNLQISKKFPETTMHEPNNTSSQKLEYSVSMPMCDDEFGQQTNQNKVKTVKKHLCFNGEESSRTIWMPDPDTTWEEDSIPGQVDNGETVEYNNGEETKLIVKDAVHLLYKEIEELQKKHERQFITFAGKYWSQEKQSMGKLLEMIMGNLSPQDKNWTYHGKFDDHCMEQLFYFVSLQKTLKSCLALLATIDIQDHPEPMEEETEGDVSAACCTTEMNLRPDVPKQCDRYNRTGNVGEIIKVCGCHATKTTTETCSDSLNELAESNVSNTAAANHNAMNCSSQTNGKRINEFEDEQQTKRLKKNKGIFACFNTKWIKTKKKKK